MSKKLVALSILTGLSVVAGAVIYKLHRNGKIEEAEENLYDFLFDTDEIACSDKIDNDINSSNIKNEESLVDTETKTEVDEKNEENKISVNNDEKKTKKQPKMQDKKINVVEDTVKELEDLSNSKDTTNNS